MITCKGCKYRDNPVGHCYGKECSRLDEEIGFFAGVKNKLSSKEQVVKLRENLASILGLTNATVEEIEDGINKFMRELGSLTTGEILGDDFSLKLRKKIDTFRFLKSQRAVETRKSPREGTLVHYGDTNTLNWLVFGSEERLDVKDDPILQAFLVGFLAAEDSLRTAAFDGQLPVGADQKQEEEKIRPIGLPKEIRAELKERLHKTVYHIVDKTLTPKQRDVVMLVLIQGKSYQEAGAILKVDKKTLYERLYGDNRGGGALKKIRDSRTLQRLQKELFENS